MIGNILETKKSPMETKKSPHTFCCEMCNYSCRKQSELNRHLNTQKHARRLTKGEAYITPTLKCSGCSKTYKTRAGLWKHTKLCRTGHSGYNNFMLDDETIDKLVKETSELDTSKESMLYVMINSYQQKMVEMSRCSTLQNLKETKNAPLETKKSPMETKKSPDEGISAQAAMKIALETQGALKYVIESNRELVRDNQQTNKVACELLQESQQVTREFVNGTHENTKELINKIVELAPKMGSTINNNDNRQIVTFNDYLENDCKNAETIHDFIHRYAIKCGDFFRNNATAIINGEVSLSFNAHKLFFESLRENPQHMNFVQTSNVHDGIHYVKEREHGEGDDYLTLYGDAEFNKYTDKFRSKGAEISVAVCQVLNQIREEIYNQRKRYCRPEPTESDYSGEYASYATQFTEDMEEYRRQYDNSVEYNSDLSNVLTRQVFSVLNLFDMDRTEGKATCKEILHASRRSRQAR